MLPFFTSLGDAAVAVLVAPEPSEKLRLTHATAAAWAADAIGEIGTAEPPARPARPARPALKAPRHLARLTAKLGRVALAESWPRSTGAALPAAIRDAVAEMIEAMGDGDK